jgi:hypothetical protein
MPELMRTKHSFPNLALATPVNHGDTVHYPNLNKAIAELVLETADSEEIGISIGGQPLGQFRFEARQEFLQLATQYSRQYGDFDTASNLNCILMTGHQPDLFHSGVWYKNFVLSKLGKQANASCINLIVDNDICSRCFTNVPVRRDGKFSVKPVAFDSPGYAIPFEERRVEDDTTFRTFVDRASEAIQPIVPNPIVQRLWPLVLEARKRAPQEVSLGFPIAAGRHLLEKESGLKTLELPLSRLADTTSFLLFCSTIISRRASFLVTYNQAVRDYRERFKVRSRSHPVPELEQIDDWTETPFWIWNSDQPFRRRLFARQCGARLDLADLSGWETSIVGDEPGKDPMTRLRGQGIKVRPRALITTMYCRLVLSDLFVHGIGGAKYDRLTDRICELFFGVAPPPFIAVSATMRLAGHAPLVSAEEISNLKRKRRDLEYHPELFVDTKLAEAGMWAAKKRELIAAAAKNRFSKQQHHRISECNQQLQKFLRHQLLRIDERMMQKTKIRQNQKAIGSREASFCLFADNLIDELKDLACSTN